MFGSWYSRFGTFAIPFIPLWHCFSEETLKAVGPFYLGYMPREVNHNSEINHSCVSPIMCYLEQNCLMCKP